MKVVLVLMLICCRDFDNCTYTKASPTSNLGDDGAEDSANMVKSMTIP